MTNFFNISNTAPEGVIPPSVRYAFYFGGIVFFLSILVTVISTKEYSPEQLKEFDEADAEHKKEQGIVVETKVHSKPDFLKPGTILGLIGLGTVLVTYYMELDKNLYILGGLLLLFFILMWAVDFLTKKGQVNNGLVEVFTDMMHMPKTMKQLAVVQFFTWIGLFAMWIYTTAAITTHIYGSSDTTSQLYNDGADWVNILFAVYNGVAALIAFGLPVMAKYTNRKITHAVSLLLGGIGLASMILFKDPTWLIVPMIGVGIAWASILSMPYAILTGSLPSNKMGIYMGIFNFFIVLPQILSATILGFTVKSLFHGDAMYALIVGGVSMIIAAVLVLFVEDK